MTLTYVESVFGRIVTGDDVEQWCLASLQKWSSTYLSELERQHGMAALTLPRVRSWQTAPSFDKWPEDQLPGVILVSVGLAEPALKAGDGRYRARWQMGLGCVVSAKTQAQTHQLAMLYIAAHRALIVQRPSLEGNAAGVVWQDEDYTQLVYDDVRTLGAGQATFTVEVEDVTTANAGPLRPDAPSDADWPLPPDVATTEIVVENYPPPDQLPPD